MDFSQHNRIHFSEKLKNETFDLLVIGGGITGCGIALDAALRGMKVALIEKHDFGWGTSSRSTKLIHGGLRYLKQLELKLVHDVGRERAVVYPNAMHVV
ncbi:MAG TPA: FAD-dependent oxidoreductase, partial [Chitinophagales bacterium]|nr:FAD-dependent oxidoreductase [Chitinophagales bacterium]